LLSAPIYLYWIKRRGVFNRITDSTLLCLFIYVVVSELLWMTLSLTGKMPWKFGTRWALSEIVLCSLSFLGLAYIFKFFSARYFERFYKYNLLFLAVVLLISTIYVSHGVIKYSRLDYEGENLLKILPVANQVSSGKGTIVMDQFLYPDYRYLVEFSGAGIEPLAAKVIFADFSDLSALKIIENSAARPVVFISGQWDSNRRMELIQALNGSNITIYGDGSQSRSFCYVSDLIAGIIAMLTSGPQITGPTNLGNPTEISILELAQVVLKLTNSKSEIIFEKLPSDDPKQRKPDIAKAKAELGWSPSVELEDGLRITIEDFEKRLGFPLVK
jgi:hypothetical protein